jgi:microcystin-dependent protein
MPSIDKIRASNGSGNASVATVQSSRSPGSSTIAVDTVDGINTTFMGSMGTPHTFIDPITSETITVISEATAVDFSGHVDGSNLEIDDIAPGYTDLGSEVGDIIVIRPTTQWSDEVADILGVSLNDDGSPKTTSLNPTGMVVPYAGSAAPTGWLLCDGASKLRTDYADLFTVIGTTYGNADGSHFNLPDLRGRAPIGAGTGTRIATFASRASNVVTVTGIDDTSNNGFQTGQAVTYHTTSGVMTGLTNDTVYYWIRTGNLTGSLASSLANALAGTAISLSSDGSGTQTFTKTLSARTVGDRGGEESHANTISEMAVHTHIQDAHTHTYSIVNAGGGGAAVGVPQAPGAGNVSTLATTATNQNTGGSTAHNNMQPFLALNYIIKT